MFPSLNENDNDKLNLFEKENNIFSPIQDNFLPNSPIFLDNNRGNADKFLNFFYTNSPYSSINEEILDKYDNKDDLIKPMQKYIINNEEDKKSPEKKISNSKEKKTAIEKQNLENKNEEVEFIIIDNMNDLDMGKRTHFSSYACSNSFSNNDKKLQNQNKKLECDIQKTEKKRDSLLLNSKEDSMNFNNLYEEEKKSLTKKNDLDIHSFVDLKDKIKNVNNNNKNNLLKMKRKRTTMEEKKTIKTKTNLLFDNDINDIDNMKENNIDNNQTKKTLSLKDKSKNLKKIIIPKSLNPPKNIYPYLTPKIKRPKQYSVIQKNNYNINKKRYNLKKYNKSHTNNINLCSNYESDSNLSNLQNTTFKLEQKKEKEKQENSFMPQIFESQAPSTIINGIEYTTILVPKIYLKKIKLDNI